MSEELAEQTVIRRTIIERGYRSPAYPSADSNDRTNIDAIPIDADQLKNQKHSKKTWRTPSRSSPPAASGVQLVTTTTTTTRTCVDCKKPAQVQCLHCSQMTCIECAQKHIAQAEEQVTIAQQFLNETMSVLDEIATDVKKRIDIEHDKLMEMVALARYQCYDKLIQAIENDKCALRNKGKKLTEMSLDQIPTFIKQMAIDTEWWTQLNAAVLYSITSNTPMIQLHRNERKDT